ncbi:hypothetical protein L195_g055462 [Trifolium pratense]|uniref:Uncharacterized protein n=1 Tax=Trifolium pratense TaxID=57577 RepID=A0A2K3KLL6_TRIPR|nr:hypothetical protein L195_g055462 [Trifolium pratense]
MMKLREEDSPIVEKCPIGEEIEVAVGGGSRLPVLGSDLEEAVDRDKEG